MRELRVVRPSLTSRVLGIVLYVVLFGMLSAIAAAMVLVSLVRHVAQ